MFKNMLKRSWLSTTRKLGRTIILSLIFFMMAALVLAAIIVKSAVSAQMDYAKSTLGGTVTIQADMEKIRSDQQQQMSAGTDRKEIFKEMQRPAVDVETANKIAGYSDYVRDYSYELSTGANVKDLETVESTSNFPGGDAPGRMGGDPSGDSSTQNDYDVSITGINAFAYIDGVERGTIEIKSGTYFDESSENSAMISYELAELNSLAVGDKITLTNVNTSKNIELTIVGIYDSAEDFTNANLIYMNTETAAKFLSSDDYNKGNYDVSNVNYYMQNSEFADEFVEKINQDFPELAEDNLKIAVDTSEYDAMSGSIESVGGFATTILVIVVIAAAIIVTLIVTINVKDRRYEMGVLLSLGATKKNIIAQIAVELLIVGTLGFALASITGNFGGKIMSDSIISGQTASSQQQSEKNFGRPGAGAGGSKSSGSSGAPEMPDNAGAPSDAGTPNNAGAPDSTDMKNFAANNTPNIELDINASLSDFLLLFAIGYLVIILALIIPSINVLKYEPKEILAGKE